MNRRNGVLALLALLALGAAPLVSEAQQPNWQQKMDESRRIAAKGMEEALALRYPASLREKSVVFVFYNNPHPFCYTYMIPGEWFAQPQEKAYRSRDGQAYASVRFWLPKTIENEDGTTLIERAGNYITRRYKAQRFGTSLTGVEFVPFESARAGIWQWRAAPITNIEPRVDFPVELVVDLSPDAVVQITVIRTTDDLLVARRIVESLKTTKDPECYFSVLESMNKSIER